MTSPFQHVDMTITYTTPDGRKRAVMIPSEPAQVDPNDVIGTMSMILVALHDRTARMEALMTDLIAVLKPMLDAMQGPEAAMDAAADQVHPLDDAVVDEAARHIEEQKSLFDEETVAGVDRFDV